ncbi:MAG: VanZ family protein [Gemmataceae bacterium]|nr:VanZ family protein [Gemmataceae bacterium]
MERPDLWIHVAVLCVWTVALGSTEYLGTARRPGALVRVALGACAFALFDELTQAIPLFRRSFDATDLLADLAGAGLGVALVACWARWSRPATTPDATL